MKNIAVAAVILLIVSFKPATVRPVTKAIIANSIAEAKDHIEYESRSDFRVVSMVSQCTAGKCSILIALQKDV